MKKIIIIILILGCAIFTGCGDKNKENQLDISSTEYFGLINKTFTEVMESNEYLYYDGYTKHFPYIQVQIKPKKKISKNDMEEQSEIIRNEILSELKKYNYKSGSIFKYNYEYINIYFYDYRDNGQLDRNEGPFLQFEILKI